MSDETRRYDPMGEDEPIQLNDVLEPYQLEESFEGNGQYEESAYDDYPEEEYVEEEPYDEEYSDYHEELDREGRLHTAIGVMNTVSTLAGVVVILLLVAMLLSLFSWLRNDILHSITLLAGGIA